MSLVNEEMAKGVLADRLLQVAERYLDGEKPSEAYVLEKLRAAEADAQRRLRAFFEPTTVFAYEPTQAEIEALGDRPWHEEAAYDYEHDFFQGEKWGYLITREKPIIQVESFSFVYPNPHSNIYRVPADWIRLDKKYGHVRLVPSSQAFVAPYGAWLMSVLGGGRNIPHMIHVRYVAGLRDAGKEYPDLLDLIKKMAVLRIVQDMFLPQSGSISADGLSQSMSVDVSRYQDSVDHMLDSLRDAIHGIRMAVV